VCGSVEGNAYCVKSGLHEQWGGGNLKIIRIVPLVWTLVFGMGAVLPEAAYGQPNYCPAADPTDNTPDFVALQACLNQAGTILLSAGSPGYILEDSLRLDYNGTVLSSVSETNRATIVAHPDLDGEMLRADAEDFEISFLIFDGNRTNRTNSCSYPNGHNLIVRGEGSSSASLTPTLPGAGRRWRSWGPISKSTTTPLPTTAGARTSAPASGQTE